jgi:tetratricopeptide (TPR) repeat protein
MQYKERRPPLQQIGGELDVGFVLEGTIRWDRAGEGHGRVRITPQLIRVADDSHLWSERYDRVLEDIFTVQSDIAEQVISQLQATILEPERQAIETRPTENMEAYQAYLLGEQYRWSGGEERSLRLAAEMLRRAVGSDPEFAAAHAKLSQVHSRLYHGKHEFTTDRLDMAKASAERALELQPNLPEAHLALGYYYYWGFRDYDRALEHFEVAAVRLPNDPDLFRGTFAILRRQGRWNDALEVLDRWRQADPQSFTVALEASITYIFLREFEKAEDEMRRAIAIAPDLPDAYISGAWNYLLWDGSTDRARSLLESTTMESPVITYLSILLRLYDRDPGSALARLEKMPFDAISVDYFFAPKRLFECICLTELGEKQQAETVCASAVVYLESEIELRPYDHRLYCAIGHAYALTGRRDDAVRAGEHAAELLPISKDAVDGSDQAIELAKIYARVGEDEKALDLIEELLSIPCMLSVELLRLDPVWDPLRDHPRFQALLKEYEVEQ